MTRGIIASPHHLASEAGAEVLREGGNAVDAALAADAVLCVAYPQMTSIGGDLFALVWPAGAERPVGVAGAGASGSLARWQTVRERGYEEMPRRGALTITVPGTVGAWGWMLEHFGSVGLGLIVAPAARLAREGYPVTTELAQSLQDNADWLHQEPEAHRLFPAMKAGMALRNPELAESLELIGREGTLAFYRGPLAAAIVRSVQDRDGFLSEDDLALYRPQLVEPISVAYGDLAVYNLPPPTQGLAALGMHARIATWDRDQLQPGLAFARALVALRDAVYPLRDRYISDPIFTEVPEAPFLDPAVHAGGGGDALAEGDTVYVCAADERGNVVSLIQSVANAFGSGVVAEGTGIMLHNRGLYFSLDPDHVNRLEPRKRTMHTLVAALATRRGRPWAAFGSMGADAQPQIHAQLLVHLRDRGLSPADSVAHPRLRVAPGGGELWVEADYPEAASIARSLPGVVLTPARQTRFGHAQALVLEESGWQAGADPRSDGSVEVV
jgi:gamma-glutamyltranspeptidase/glutathione hydrolase